MLEQEINRYDVSNMFDVLRNFGNQIEEAVAIGNVLNPPKELGNINKIIISGLGGSAIAGDLIRSILLYEIKIPVYVNRNYLLPAFADENTLVIISSYSGNTEESLSAYEDALKKNCKVVCVSSGGKLSLLAENANQFLIALPKGYQPRCALAFSFFTVLIFLSKLNIIEEKSLQINGVIRLMKEKCEQYAQTEGSNNPTINIAKHLQGKIPIIYSSSDLLDIANYRWRCQINENSKCLAYGNLIPEMNHNEIVGWQENPEFLKKLAVVTLLDRQDHPRNLRRIKIVNGIIEKLWGIGIDVEGEGETKLERLFDLILMGDWISFYLAILYKTDPTPVEKINILKNKLSEN